MVVTQFLGWLQLIANVALMLEYEAVCLREEHRAASGLTEIEVQTFLDAVAALVEPVESHFIWRPQLRDPGDEMVLEAAVNGAARQIVTFDLRHFSGATDRFGIKTLLPRDALRSLKG